MCGINGFVVTPRRRGEVASIIDSMNEALHHRGPDADGQAIHGAVALGMTRLSIIDRDRGQQPMESPDGRYCLVYNGELYSHTLLRPQLERLGRRFSSRSDTEVVLAAFEAKGLDALDSFNGMFAFAVSDSHDGSLTLVRDHLGVKPLFYYVTPGGGLVFSSELPAILRHPDVPRRLDHAALHTSLVDRFAPDPFTLLEGVRVLPPGCWLRWRDGSVEVRRYYEPRLDPQQVDHAAAVEQLREILADVAGSQLVSDEPIGAFLSGGIDSATVAAFANEAIPGRLHTFTAGFQDPSYDERAGAAEVASHIGSDHHPLLIPDGGFGVEELRSLVIRMGQPHVDTSPIPLLRLCNQVRGHAKVVLSGDGGDELFGGYDHIAWAGSIDRAARRVPPVLRRVAALAMKHVARFDPVRARRYQKGLLASLGGEVDRLRMLRSHWSPDSVHRALKQPAEDLLPPTSASLTFAEGLTGEEKMMEYLIKTSLVGSILTKSDRIGMAAGLEIRVPLLDRRVVDFALRLPLRSKRRGGLGKIALREAGSHLLPATTYSRPKQALVTPMERWLNDDFWDLAAELTRPGLPLADLFDGRFLADTMTAGRSPGARLESESVDTRSTRAWVLVQLGVWLDEFGVAL